MHPALIRLLATAALLAAVITCQESQPATLDLIVRGCLLLDGTGAPPRRADVGVTGERIVAVGDLALRRARRELGGTGFVVAPGFIDVHTHVDADILAHPGAENFVRMGVTTIITGNCGGSAEDIGAHLLKAQAQGVSVNYGTLVGHGTVRTGVMKTARRKPSSEELDQMKAQVARAMDAGAFGLSTGLIYVPGTYAQTAELVELSKVVATAGGIYVSHMRNEGLDIDRALDEIFTIGREARLPIHVSHLKSSGKAVWGQAPRILKRLDEARAAGLRLTCDAYAYDASSTSLDVLFPSDELDRGRKAFVEKLASDAGFRSRMQQAVLDRARHNGFADLAYAAIANAPHQPQLAGKSLADAAEMLFGTRTPEKQAEAAAEVMIRAEGSRVGMVYHGMNDEDVRTFVKAPYVAIASDAGVRTDDGSKPHPRGSGNNVRVLGRFVRDLHAITLEDAVRKMTSLPASVFGLAGRGTIQVGNYADLVTFDPRTVADQATYDEPLREPVGIRSVVVNGTVVAEDGQPTKLRPGQVLRRGRM